MPEEKRREQLSGIRKSAVLLISLPPETSSKVLSRLDRDIIEAVTREIARIGEVSKEERNNVLSEFFKLNVAKEYVDQGGFEYARTLLQRSLKSDTANEILSAVQQSIQLTPFSFLRKAEPENLLTFIQDEHPQTIALIVSHLPSKTASEVLSGLPPKKQIEVVKRIAKMEQTNPEVIKEVEQGLERRLSTVVSQKFEKAGGIESVAEMLNLTDRSTEKGILETIEEEDPELVEKIRRKMFIFEDIMLVNDKGIQAMLKEIDNEDLALSLKTASEELKEKIFRNMSERASQMIMEEMEYMGPVRITDVEMAQQRLVDVVRRLEETGEVIIQGRSGEEEVIV